MSENMESTMKLPPVRGLVWKHVILYDGMCNFCTSCVNLVRRYDTGKKFTLAPLQSTDAKAIMTAIGRDSDDLVSVIYIRRTLASGDGQAEAQEVFDKSDAAIHVCEELIGIPSFLVSIVCTVLPKRLRDAVYDLVAKNRYRIMGKKEDCGCTPKLPNDAD